MSYHLGEVSNRADLDGIVDIIWTAMDGVDPSHQVFYPTFGSGSEAREAAIVESKERIWQEHQGDPASHWIYIREGEAGASGGRIVGGCQWRIYEQNPFPNGTPEIEATWWPAGAGREFASEVVKQCYTPRTVWMARPHTGLSLMCVLPELQRRGLGSRLMTWGLERTDKLGLESFIEATGPGQTLYATCGYRPVRSVEVDMEKVDAGKREQWKDLERQKLPIGYVAMWRPVKGSWEGEEPQDFFKRIGMS